MGSFGHSTRSRPRTSRSSIAARAGDEADIGAAIVEGMERKVPEIGVGEAQRRLSNGEPMIDVREPHEHDEVRIPGARLLPMSEFLERYQEELPEDAELMIQCRSGGRSAEVTRVLLERGYRALNVAGGILAWESAGLPVKRGE
jgi:rhodanese-related sulfurtransferase